VTTWRQLEYKYRIDAFDRITFVNKAWLDFALANGAPELARQWVVGQSLWRYVSGHKVRPLYEALFERIRTHATHLISVPFRCDSPELRRFMQLRLSPLGRGGIELAGRLLSSEPRVPGEIFVRDRGRSRRTLTACSWCKRLELAGGRWEHAEQVVAELGLFGTDAPATVEHEICPLCVETFRRILRGEDPDMAW